MVLVFSKNYPHIDTLKLLKICIVHDLGEAIGGDIPAIHQTPTLNKSSQERKDLQLFVSSLPTEIRNEILDLWEEYDAAITNEAKLAKAFDKLETVLQHTQGKTPADFDYAFNLDYGQKWTSFDDLTSQLRAIIDAETKRRHLQKQ